MTNWKIIGFFFAGTVTFLLLLRWQGNALVTTSAPYGIVSLELSSTAAHSAAITAEWRGAKLGAFGWNILLDFFVIPFYGLFLYSLCGYFSVHYVPTLLQRVGVLMAFGSLLAMLFDILENIFMIISMHVAVTTAGAVLTSIFAVIKFSLVTLALLYIAFSAIYLVLAKRFARS